MTETDLEAILDECLHDLSTRCESIEGCLQRCPQDAGQLAPLVQVADHIQKTRHPTLSASVAKAIEQRLLKRAKELRQSRARPWALPFSLRPLGTVAATLIVVLALVLAGGGGIVYASTDSLPGGPLYGVKRATEQVQLFLAPAGTKRSELHIRFAQKRMEEVQALAEIKGQVAEEALAAMAEETELALKEAEKAPAQDKLALLDKLVNLTQRQQAVLGRVQTKAPEAAQKGLSRALEASQQGYEKVREALEKEKPGRDVKPSKSPLPTKTPKPTHTPKATHTLKPTKTPKSTYAPGEHDQGQGKGKKDKVLDEEGGGPPAEPPGKEKDKSSEGGGPPAEPPGRSGEEHGPPDAPPGQSGEDHGRSGKHGGGKGKGKGKGK